MTTDPDIKSIRERRGWTQAQMAEYLGLDRSSVSRMEAGRQVKGPVLRLLRVLEASEVVFPVVAQSIEGDAA